ncbi:hypothetical protein CRG98_022975 [Punica granatum]|uniref:Uncharacterized protein n=1 Tax=Punica granatum TaxID=22663 RepID=A0A2I0JK06_PUNGR|nr:hypothetical protein CRG98_022975 [Punica granatum]
MDVSKYYSCSYIHHSHVGPSLFVAPNLVRSKGHYPPSLSVKIHGSLHGTTSIRLQRIKSRRKGAILEVSSTFPWASGSNFGAIAWYRPIVSTYDRYDNVTMRMKRVLASLTVGTSTISILSPFTATVQPLLLKLHRHHRWLAIVLRATDPTFARLEVWGGYG